METQRVIVGKLAPDFDLPCTRGVGLRDRATLAGYRDRWLVLVFYPRDFSLVCPTELTALSVRMEEFRRRGCDVLGISTDSLEWRTRHHRQRRAFPGGDAVRIDDPLAAFR